MDLLTHHDGPVTRQVTDIVAPVHRISCFGKLVRFMIISGETPMVPRANCARTGIARNFPDHHNRPGRSSVPPRSPSQDVFPQAAILFPRNRTAPGETHERPPIDRP